jgi:hypothetical protein
VSAGATAAARCTGEPISWLRLEQLALEELPATAASTARAHLADCPACAAAFAQIREDARPLPALPALALLAPGASSDAAASVRAPDEADQTDRARAGRPPWWRRWQLTGGGLALAGAMAALLLWLQAKRPGVPPDPELVVASASRTVRVKGGGSGEASDVTVTLVRERDGAISFDPADISPGDRWKVQLTCAPVGGAAQASSPASLASLSSVWIDVAVVQQGKAGFPLAPALVACGNDVVVPGAFRITGGGAAICVTLDAAEPDRARFVAGKRRDAICSKLAAAPPP